jgi:hypothetical protein
MGGIYVQAGAILYYLRLGTSWSMSAEGLYVFDFNGRTIMSFARDRWDWIRLETTVVEVRKDE